MAEARLSAGSGGCLDIHAVIYQGQYLMRQKSLGSKIFIASFGNAAQNADMTCTRYEFETEGVDIRDQAPL